jgi:hypothetical protein
MSKEKLCTIQQKIVCEEKVATANLPLHPVRLFDLYNRRGAGYF